MITVSLRAGAILGGADDDALDALTESGRRGERGLRIADDILNVEGDAKALGKGTGNDESGETYIPRLVE